MVSRGHEFKSMRGNPTQDLFTQEPDGSYLRTDDSGNNMKVSRAVVFEAIAFPERRGR